MKFKYAFLGSFAAIILGVVGVIAGADTMAWLLILGVPMLVITCLAWLVMKLARLSARVAVRGVGSDAARPPDASLPKRQIGAAVAVVLLVGVLGVVIWYQVNKNELAVQAAANEQARDEQRAHLEALYVASKEAERFYWVRPGGAWACPSIEAITTAWSVADAHGVYAANAYLEGHCSRLPEGVKVRIDGDGSVPVVSTDRGYMVMRELRH